MYSSQRYCQPALTANKDHPWIKTKLFVQLTYWKNKYTSEQRPPIFKDHILISLLVVFVDRFDHVERVLLNWNIDIFLLQARTLNNLTLVFFLQICLQVQGKGDTLSSFDGFFDLPEQAQIREDCTQLVGMSVSYPNTHACVIHLYIYIQAK